MPTTAPWLIGYLATGAALLWITIYFGSRDRTVRRETRESEARRAKARAATAPRV